MEHDQLIGELQNRARLPSRGDAERVVQATLETLGERLSAGAAHNLAAQLPVGIGAHLRATAGEEGQQPSTFTSSEFIDRVSAREGSDVPDAAFHTRAVLEVLGEATQGAILDKVREQLPDDYDRLFAGSEGQMPN